jgi:hypothetical protein
MIKQNSERIFLQPIDQLYDNIKSKDSQDDEDQSKFFDDYTHGFIDYLNISTDSETRNNSVDDEDMSDGKLTDLLCGEWKNKVDYFKAYQLSVMRCFVFQKMNFMRNTLNATMGQSLGRSQSCPSVVPKSEWKPVNPFNLCKDSPSLLNAVDDLKNGLNEKEKALGVKVSENFFKHD